MVISGGRANHNMAATGDGATNTEEAQMQGRREIIKKIHWERGMKENKTNTLVAAATPIRSPAGQDPQLAPPTF